MTENRPHALRLEDLTRDRLGTRTLRPEIRASWLRSLHAGVDPDMAELPVDDSVEVNGPLARIARPVLTQFAHDVGDVPIVIMLTDAHARLLFCVATRGVPDTGREVQPGTVYAENVAGTTAISTALRTRSASFVDGHEHFLTRLAPYAGGTELVYDPTTYVLAGTVTFAGEADDASPMMVALAKRAAREIERTWRASCSDANRPEGWSRLTPAEVRVVQLVAQGLTNRQIGERLQISRWTVDSHLRGAFRKLGVNSRVALTRLAVNYGGESQ